MKKFKKKLLLASALALSATKAKAGFVQQDATVTQSYKHVIWLNDEDKKEKYDLICNLKVFLEACKRQSYAPAGVKVQDLNQNQMTHRIQWYDAIANAMEMVPRVVNASKEEITILQDEFSVRCIEAKFSIKKIKEDAIKINSFRAPQDGLFNSEDWKGSYNDFAYFAKRYASNKFSADASIIELLEQFSSASHNLKKALIFESAETLFTIRNKHGQDSDIAKNYDDIHKKLLASAKLLEESKKNAQKALEYAKENEVNDMETMRNNELRYS